MVIKTLGADQNSRFQKTRDLLRKSGCQGQKYQSFCQIQAVLTVDEDSFIHQDLPHSHPLAPGLQAVALLQQPVHQLFARAALPGGGNSLSLFVTASLSVEERPRGGTCRSSGDTSYPGSDRGSSQS